MIWPDTLGKQYYLLNTGCRFERVSIERGVLFSVKFHSINAIAICLVKQTTLNNASAGRCNNTFRKACHLVEKLSFPNCFSHNSQLKHAHVIFY